MGYFTPVALILDLQPYNDNLTCLSNHGQFCKCQSCVCFPTRREEKTGRKFLPNYGSLPLISKCRLCPNPRADGHKKTPLVTDSCNMCLVMN